jgi:hypothetical protein
MRLGRGDLFLKTPFKELLFAGPADDLDLIALALAKGIRDLLLRVLYDWQLHCGAGGQGTSRSWAS